MHVRLGTDIVGGGGDGRLEHLVLRDRAPEVTQTVPAGGLFLVIGARPHTEWLPPEVRRDARGFVLTGADFHDEDAWPLARSPFPPETSLPGVLAAGDVRPGSVERVASAVGEGSVAIQASTACSPRSGCIHRPGSRRRTSRSGGDGPAGEARRAFVGSS